MPECPLNKITLSTNQNEVQKLTPQGMITRFIETQRMSAGTRIPWSWFSTALEYSFARVGEQRNAA
jgi:hypothetical protein